MCTEEMGNEQAAAALGLLPCCPVYGVYERIARKCQDFETLMDLQKAIGTCPAVCPEPDSDPAVSAAGAPGDVGR